MTKQLFILIFATGLALVCVVVGVLLDILITNAVLETGEVHSGVGAAVGLITFVSLWYGYIRNGRPVWQPGRRFWIRWAWLFVCGFPLVWAEPSL